VGGSACARSGARAPAGPAHARASELAAIGAELSALFEQRTAQAALAAAAAEKALEHARAEAHECREALRDGLSRAEQAASQERTELKEKLTLAHETALTMLATERSRREEAEAHVEWLQQEARDRAEQLQSAEVAMRESQRAALASAMSLRRVALEAKADYEQRAAREAEEEAARAQAARVEEHLRAAHAEAHAAEGLARAAQAEAEAVAAQAAETGRRALAEAAEERAAKLEAVQRIAAAEMAAHEAAGRAEACLNTVADVDRYLVTAIEGRKADAAKYCARLEELAAEQAARDEASAALAAHARGEMDRAIAATAAAASAHATMETRRLLTAAHEAAEAEMVRSHAAALRELRMVMEARIRTAVAHQAKEIEELEFRLVRLRVEGAQAQSACDATHAALEARTMELRTVERTHEQALTHAEARARIFLRCAATHEATQLRRAELRTRRHLRQSYARSARSAREFFFQDHQEFSRRRAHGAATHTHACHSHPSLTHNTLTLSRTRDTLLGAQFAASFFPHTHNQPHISTRGGGRAAPGWGTRTTSRLSTREMRVTTGLTRHTLAHASASHPQASTHAPPHCWRTTSQADLRQWLRVANLSSFSFSHLSQLSHRFHAPHRPSWHRPIRTTEG
jgi:hypothetical protein